MRQTTTPTHSFCIPFEPEMVERLLLTYTQNNVIVLEKRKEDMDVNGQVWSVKLTQ